MSDVTANRINPIQSTRPFTNRDPMSSHDRIARIASSALPRGVYSVSCDVPGRISVTALATGSVSVVRYVCSLRHGRMEPAEHSRRLAEFFDDMVRLAALPVRSTMAEQTQKIAVRMAIAESRENGTDVLDNAARGLAVVSGQSPRSPEDYGFVHRVLSEIMDASAIDCSDGTDVLAVARHYRAVRPLLDSREEYTDEEGRPLPHLLDGTQRLLGLLGSARFTHLRAFAETGSAENVSDVCAEASKLQGILAEALGGAGRIDDVLGGVLAVDMCDARPPLSAIDTILPTLREWYVKEAETITSNARYGPRIRALIRAARLVLGEPPADSRDVATTVPWNDLRARCGIAKAFWTQVAADFGLDADRDDLLRQVLALFEDVKGSVRVYIRIRPGDLAAGDAPICTTEGNVLLTSTNGNTKVRIGDAHKGRGPFWSVIPRQLATNREAFAGSDGIHGLRDAVEAFCPRESACGGRNIMLFFYGYSGTGKTYLSIGTEKDAGIMSMILEEIQRRRDDVKRIRLRIMEGIPRDSEVFESYVKNTPLGDVGEPEDVGHLIRFLIGDEARWITGAAINIDGGQAVRRGPDFSSFLRDAVGDEVLTGKKPA